MVKTISLLLFLTYSVLAQSRWEWQNPLPLAADLKKILPLDSNRCVAIGDVGTIILTNDGGRTWHTNQVLTESAVTTPIPGQFSLLDVCFSDPLTGWTINSRKIFKSNDGGVTWRDSKLEFQGNVILNSIYFSNSKTGWILANEQDDEENLRGKLYKTIDAGNTWGEIETNTSNQYISMDFPDSANGFILSVAGNVLLPEETEYTLLSTTDSGMSWQKNKCPGGRIFKEQILDFLSPQIGWIGKYCTIDGGKTWTNRMSALPDTILLEEIHFIDEQTGWAIGNYADFQSKLGYFIDQWLVLNTRNGGQTWTIQLDGIPEGLRDLHFYNHQLGWICGKSGILFQTADGGENWIRITKGLSQTLNDVEFVNAQTGWIAGSEGMILRTDNGGQTWIRQNSGVFNYLRAIDFLNENIGWSAGDNMILHTDNGGQNWRIQFDTPGFHIRDIHFINSQIGWAVGNNVSNFYGVGFVLRTKNSGQTWERVEAFTSWDLGAVFFIDENNGWVCGNSGTMFATNDGGQTWNKQNIPIPGFLRTIQFVDRIHGWCADSDYLNFYRTDNGGLFWEKIPWENFNNSLWGVSSFFFLNKDIGWAGGFFNGGIAKTEDGGRTWELQSRPLGYAIRALYFSNNRRGWAVGNGGTILSYTDPDTSGTIFPYPNESPFNKRTGVYPNPVRTAVTLYFNLTRSQEVIIDIFNELGQKVDSFGKFHATEGLQLKWWEPKGLPSGIYFIRIKCEEYTSAIPCTLVK